MANWFRKIRKLAEEAGTKKVSREERGIPNGAFKEPSHIDTFRELMEFSNVFEKSE